MNRIEGLDLLRFVAAFSVLIYHYFFIGPLQGVWPPAQRLDIAHIGDFGVDVFFIISGFVIALSANGRTFTQFAKSRFVRIFPAFLICSMITAATSIMLPGVDAKEIFYRWLASLTLHPQWFGQELLSGVYWTLSIEVKFYFWVAILLLLGLWRKLNVVIPVWLGIAFLNEFSLHNQWIHDYLLTQYIGHFIAGILLYQLKSKVFTTFMPLGFVLSSVLIWKSVSGIESWLGGSYGIRFSDIATFLIAPIAILLVFCMTGINKVKLPSHVVSTLGAMSYTLYLLHADFGFFQRAMLERVFFVQSPDLRNILSDSVVVTVATISSLLLAAIVAIYIEPPIKRMIRNLLDLQIFRRK